MDATDNRRLIITKMVLENFKSYAGVQEIGPFHKRFSSIVGPNGSGKSNVIDAMLFVFGKRAKQLRLNKVSELIHKSANFPDLEYARVSVHFVVIQDDASEDNFTVVEGTEMVITRTAYNNNQSKYSIDNKTSTYTEVGELLRGYGVDLDNNRFLILQGEVEQIAMMKPKAPSPNEDGLLEYLEDIIGSNKFADRINESMKALEQLNELRLDKINRVKFAERERDNLSGAKTEVESLLDKEREIRRQRNVLYQVNRHISLEQKAKQERRLQDCREKQDAEKARLGDREERLKTIEVDYETARSEYKACDEELQSVTHRFSEFERRDVKIQEDMKFSNANLKKAKEQLKKDISKENESSIAITKINADYETALVTFQDLEKKKIEEDSKMEQILADLKSNTEVLRGQLDAAQIDLAESERSISVFQTERDSLATKMELVKSRAHEAEKNLRSVQTKLAKLNESKAATMASGVDKELLYNQLTADIETLESNIKELNEHEQALQAEVRQKITDTEEARSAMAASKNSSTNAVVAVVLKAARNGGPLSKVGVHGRLGDLASIDQEYDVAISTSCGLLDFIVVETTEGAQKCMNFLRDNNAGRSSFIALDQMDEWRSKMGRPFTTPAGTQRLFDIVSPQNANIRPALYLALKDTLVAENLDAAVKIAYVGDRAAHRVVTKGGDLIDVSGSMTGGGKQTKSGLMKTHTAASTAKQGGGSASVATSQAGAEEEITQVVIDRLEMETKEKQSLLTAVRKERDDFQTQVSKKKKEIKSLHNELEKLTVAMTSFAEQEAQYQAQLQQLSQQQGVSSEEQGELANLASLIEAINKQCEQVAPKYQSRKQAVAKIQREISDVGGPSLARAKQRMEMVNSQMEKASSAVSTLQVDQGTLQKQIQKCIASREKNEREVTKLEEKLTELDEQQKQMEAQAMEVIAAVSAKKALMQDREEKLNEMKKIYEVLKAEIAKIRSGEVDLSFEIEKATKEMRELSNHVLGWEQKILAVRKQHADEYAEWTAAFDAAQQGFEQQQSQLQAASASGGGGGINMESSMPSILRMVPPVQLKDSDILPDLSPQQLEHATNKEEIDVLTREINALEAEKERLKGNVNMNALIDYMKKDANYRFRLAELEEMTLQRNTLRAAYEELRRQRLECFMAGYSVISLKLKEMYQMITLGGDAELELVDSLDPFSEGIVFSVRPPKKSWKNISNLSGGEKTLSSLALVFALHHFKPTPLYVMDEIDAALDFKNVSIVANYIKDRTKNAQFVIISLRNNMFELADRLVGIYKTNDATKSVTINPKMFGNIGNSDASNTNSSNATTASSNSNSSSMPVSAPKLLASSDGSTVDMASTVAPRMVLGDATNRK